MQEMAWIGESPKEVNSITENFNDNCEVERNDNVQIDAARGLNFDRELPDEVMLSFFGENELAQSEMDWLKSHGELSEFAVLKLISKIIKNRAIK
jgi:hypothetical protein